MGKNNIVFNIKTFYLYKLYFLRRYGAKLSYELKLHTADALKGMDYWTCRNGYMLGF